jgi:hypothetical protein
MFHLLTRGGRSFEKNMPQKKSKHYIDTISMFSFPLLCSSATELLERVHIQRIEAKNMADFHVFVGRSSPSYKIWSKNTG